VLHSLTCIHSHVVVANLAALHAAWMSGAFMRILFIFLFLMEHLYTLASDYLNRLFCETHLYFVLLLSETLRVIFRRVWFWAYPRKFKI
jgi:hypothetical protein